MSSLQRSGLVPTRRDSALLARFLKTPQLLPSLLSLPVIKPRTGAVALGPDLLTIFPVLLLAAAALVTIALLAVALRGRKRGHSGPDGTGANKDKHFDNAVFELSPEPIVGVDRDGAIQRWNRAAERLYGLAALSGPAAHLKHIAVRSKSGDIGDLLKALRRGEAVYDHLSTHIRRDRSLAEVALSVLPVRDETGQAVGAAIVIRDATADRRVERALRESEKRTSALLKAASGTIVRLSVSGAKLEHVSGPAGPPLFLRDLGETAVSVDTLPQLVAGVRAALHRQDTELVTFRGRGEQGRRQYEARIAPCGLEEALVIVRDITETATGANTARTAVDRPSDLMRTVERRTQELARANRALEVESAERARTEQALLESERRYELAAQATNDGLWDWDLDQNRMRFSPRWRSMLGLADSAVGNDSLEWFNRIHPADRLRVFAELTDHIKGRTTQFENEHRVLHQDGAFRWVVVRSVSALGRGEKLKRLTGSMSDITSRKRAEKQLLYRALHDSLTGLPNRTLFLRRLERASGKRRRQSDQRFGLLFIDVDRFKQVNDTLGHLVGDQLLAAIADRLKPCVRPGDTIARLGGDEFAVLVENLRDASDASRVARRIQKALRTPFPLEEHEISVAASIGIALSLGAGERAADLLRAADAAMYRAKARGQGGYEFFDRGQLTQGSNLQEAEEALRKALRRDEFVIHYQPIASMTSGKIVACEALLRWTRRDRSVMPPAEFIPLAEDAGLSTALNEWVLRRACAQARRWQKEGLPLIRVAVNLSLRHAEHQSLEEVVRKVLSESALDPTLLQLEVTEGALLDSPDLAIRSLQELRSIGVTITLDDFGAGDLSLRFLRRFPLTALKLQRSFLDQVATSAGEAAMASGVVALAHSLELGITATGVETKAQLDLLRSHNFDQVQGFAVSRPVAPQQFSELLRERVQLISSAGDVPAADGRQTLAGNVH